MRRLAALLLTVIAGSALLPAGAIAAAASLPDIEDEVMCTICGTTLQLSSSPQAERERVFINELIAQGKTKDQIKAALVDEYGEDVIADPKTPWLWIVPVAVALIAAIGVAFAIGRWRGRGPTAEPELPPPLSPEDAQRLDAELSR